jgi:hypothetical protein
MSKVIFSGENPGLTLYEAGTDRVVAAVSYWRCVYSAHGDGNAALVWTDPMASGLGDASVHAIYTDNPAMARLVTERFVQHFGGFKDRGFLDVDPTHARFFQEGDGRWYHRVVANTGSAVVELTWWDVLDYQLRQRTDYQLGPTNWDLATVICPCKNATILVNNQRVTGEVRWSSDGEEPQSSAFLAFSETWREA